MLVASTGSSPGLAISTSSPELLAASPTLEGPHGEPGASVVTCPSASNPLATYARSKTPDLIPLCHPLMITGVDLAFNDIALVRIPGDGLAALSICESILLSLTDAPVRGR